MSYPTKIPRSRDRRKLGRGQQSPTQSIATTTTGTSHIVDIAFAQPVNIAGPIPITVGTLTQIGATNVSSTEIKIQMSGAVTGLAWSLPTPVPNVGTQFGGRATGGSGTF